MSQPHEDSGVLLVRHACVAERYQGICYGRSDVELGTDGERQSCELAEVLATRTCVRVVHSGMQRTRFLAERLAQRFSAVPVCCEELQERDFGTWELQSWNAIYARHGDELLRMMTDPETYRPGGGETTFELRDRVVRWFESLPQEGVTIAVTHGGPVAALLGTQRRLSVREWPGLIPRCGESVHIPTAHNGAFPDICRLAGSTAQGSTEGR